jgi:hypothetical protein
MSRSLDAGNPGIHRSSTASSKRANFSEAFVGPCSDGPSSPSHGASVDVAARDRCGG